MISSGDMASIQKLISRFANEIRGHVKSAFELAYFSRGAWTYNQVLLMSQAEREIASDFINERLEIEGKKMFPQY